MHLGCFSIECVFRETMVQSVIPEQSLDVLDLEDLCFQAFVDNTFSKSAPNKNICPSCSISNSRKVFCCERVVEHQNTKAFLKELHQLYIYSQVGKDGHPSAQARALVTL